MSTATRRLAQAWRSQNRSLWRSLASSSSSPLRSLHTSSSHNEQHLLWSGTLLDKTSPNHTPLELDLLLAAGGGDDVVDVASGGVGGVTLLGAPATSPTQGHALLCYRTIEARASQDGAVEEAATMSHQQERSGLSRVLAIGRNTHAQLGCGFASHEATFGLVRPGFSGAGGIAGTAAGPAQSWLLTADEQGGRARNAFACGNNTQGQLGLQLEASSSHQPQLQLVPSPRAVPTLPSDSSATSGHDEAGWRIDDLAVGLDHAVLVRSRSISGDVIEAQVCTTGLNTDGQLGRPLAASHPATSALPEWRGFGFESVLSLRFDVDASDDAHAYAPPLRATAGGDACLAWTTGPQPRVWAWGNNEYGQCLVTGEGSEDQVARPTEVTEQVRRSLGDTVGIKDIKVGGSWTAVLDDTGALHMAGFGPVAPDGPSSFSAFAPLHKVTHTDDDAPLPPLATLSASLDSLVAVSACKRLLFAWGIDRRSGSDDEGSTVLGLAASDDQEGDGREHLGRFTRPREVTGGSLSRWMGPRGRIEAASVGGEQSWVLIEDGEEPQGVWRGSGK